MPTVTTETAWRTKTRSWLNAVVAYHQRLPYISLRDAALPHQFPQDAVFTIVGWLPKELAGLIVKAMIRSAAKDLNVQLSDEAIDILADIVVAMLG